MAFRKSVNTRLQESREPVDRQLRATPSVFAAVTGVAVIGGPGEMQSVHLLRAARTAAVAGWILSHLRPGTPVGVRGATPPWYGTQALEPSLSNGEAITLEPIENTRHAAFGGPATGPIAYAVSMRSSTRVHTLGVDDPMRDHWLTSRQWTHDLTR